jgi:AcrR family transcriptional regulator
MSGEGWDGTTMSAIAGRAGVGVGTLYNYFPSKDALVASVAQRRTEEALRRSGEILDGGFDDPSEAVLPVLGEVLRMMEGFGRPLLREVVSASLRSAAGDLSRGMYKADMMVVEEMERRLSELRSRGRLDCPQDPDELALLAYSAAMGLLMFWVFEDGLGLDWLLSRVDTAVSAVMKGLCG